MSEACGQAIPVGGSGGAPMFLTGDVPPVGGRIKERPEDFLVEELPLYEPCGEGEHLYLFVEKRGLSTSEMIRVVARHFRVGASQIGYAGLKDKAAITRQLISIRDPRRRLDSATALEHPRISILWSERHTNRLRRGHLKGNRFVIRIRGVDMSMAVRASRVLRALERRGVPNRAGSQRFGYLMNNHRVGLALLRGDDRAVLDEMLGPVDSSLDVQHEPRESYAAGKYEEAIRAYSPRAVTERKVLRALANGADGAGAVRAIGSVQRGFYVTAFQSALFNTVLEMRMREGTIGALEEGDLAWKHDNGAVFAVDSEVLADASTAERLDRVEISPSGPMWGESMTRAGGGVGEREREVLRGSGIDPGAFEVFRRRWGERVEGARKPLRVPLLYPDVEGGVDEHGHYVRCSFDLPRGAFATEVMREVMKPAGGAPGDDGESGDEGDDGRGGAR